MKKKLIYVLLGITLVISYSCKDYMTIEPEGFIKAEQVFETADDAISAVHGLYGLMQPLVDQIYLAGSAQGDLVLAARGADKYIAEIAQNRITPENPYTDYTNFYKLIVACNNAITGVGNINKKDPINFGQEKYNFTVAEIKCIRSWAYLQMVKIWEDVPFVTDEITSIDQIHDQIPKNAEYILNNILEDILDSFDEIQTARLSNYYSFDEVNRSRAQVTQQAARFLLADIYLEKGDYIEAYNAILPMLPYGERDSQTLRGINPSLSPRFWHEKINGYMAEALYSEWGWYIDFDGSKGQKNSLQKWTNNKDGGIYALKPSANAIEYWNNTGMMLLNYQVGENGYYFDYLQPRGGGMNYVGDSDGYPVLGCMGDSLRGAGLSYNIDGGDTLIFKYLMKERFISRRAVEGDPNSNDDALFLIYRTGPFFLKTIEMMNNMGLSYQALYFLNGGEQSVESTRYRVKSMPFKLDENGASVQEQVNRFILEEMALEGAFEGLRWFDLVRFAKRPGYESWLGEYVSMKYPESQREMIKSRLSDRNKWHWPYYYKNVASNRFLNQKPGY